MRKPGYLLNLGFRRGLQVRAVRRLLAQKYGCGSFVAAAVFSLFRCCKSGFPLTRLQQIALRKRNLRELKKGR